MTIQRDSISNFIGGVSQQTDKLMLPNQSKVLLNHLPDVVEGLKRRPPSQYVAKLLNNRYSGAYPYIHSIFIEDEEYFAILDGSTIKVFDYDGTEISSSNTNDPRGFTIDSDTSSYITCTNPLEQFSATTIGTNTYIVNKTKTVTLDTATYTQSYPYNALVFVKQGNFSTTYTITLNGTAVSITTDDDNVSTIKTSTIASNLKTKIEENSTLNAAFTVTRKGSTLRIKNNTDADFTISCDDSHGNTNMFAFYKETDTATDLPLVALNGFILKITQSAKDGGDDYYVKFKTQNGATFDVGTWVECPQPEIKYKFKADTMPIVLERLADGSFHLHRVAWGERLAGDEDTAPTPSFVGNTIKEITTFKGRLGFITNDKVIFSDVTNVYSFWRKTVLTTLDTDPIDVSSNAKMETLRHSLPYNEEMVLFGETTQFTLKGGDTFSNSTVSMDLVTAYQCSKYCKPIALGANGYFVYENGGYSRIMRLFVSDSYTIDAEDITVECPSYIPDKVFKIAGSIANHTVACLSQQEQNSLYIYNFYMNGRESLQSAWSKWQFDNSQILNIDFRYHKLYIVLQYSDGVYLEVIDFTPKKTENTLSYLLYLDRKYYVQNATYNSATNKTSFTLPYTIQDTDTFKVVNSKGFNINYSVNDSTVTVKGNHIDTTDSTKTDLIVGNVFDSIWQPPTIYVRFAQGGNVKVMEGILMLRDINLAYSESGHFEVTVTPKYTTHITSKFKFTGKITGLPSATLGQTPVESGTFLIPVIAKNDEIAISVENNSYLPSCYLSMEWIGDYVQRGGK